MKTVVVDTNILIDYANGYAPWLEPLLSLEKHKIQLVLPTIVIAEYFTSTALEKKYEVQVADKMFAFFTKQDLTEEIAKVLGTILRRKTYQKGAGMADLIIAATALHLDAKLATRNKDDFAKIPDLLFFEPEKTKYD